jgi:hypothetical protein
MLHTGSLQEVYEAWELHTLVAAAICHDTNHQRFNSVYNIKAETPLGIPYEDQSIMEMHHLTQALPEVNRDDIALFHVFDIHQSRKAWALFIRIMLLTGVASYFELVKKVEADLDQGRSI